MLYFETTLQYYLYSEKLQKKKEKKSDTKFNLIIQLTLLLDV